MFRWKKEPAPSPLTWSDAATKALQQAITQAPVPTLLKGKIERELRTVAEAKTRAAGRAEVTPQDLMAGLMEKLPPAMQAKVAAALQGDTKSLEDLKRTL